MAANSEKKKKKAKAADLAPVLPGEQKVDKSAVDKAVRYINDLYTAKGLEMARAIGEFVLQTFFDNNIDYFRWKGTKHVTFRELSKREDLQVSASFIYRAVSIVDQLRILPEDIAGSLPYTHHTLLLPVKNSETKIEMAKKATAEDWSKRKLTEEINKAIAAEKSDRPGRPPLPAFAKAFTRLHKAIDMAYSEDITPDSFTNLKVKEARRMLDEVEEAAKRLILLKNMIEEAVEKYEAQKS